MPPALPPVAPTSAERALHRLVLLPDAQYEEMLAVPAEYAMRAVGADSASLSRWERDRGMLRTLVNVGELSAAETRFPREEVYEVATDSAIARVLSGGATSYSTDDPDLDQHGRSLLEFSAKHSSLSVPLTVDGRLWGELWLSRADASLSPDDLPAAEAVAVEVGSMVAVAERLQRMARLAFEDPLTGVGNRRVLDDALRDLLVPEATGVTVVMCDIDNLKDLNDEYGHGVGDRAIVATADALATAASHVPGSVTVRLGGDEFAVLLVGEQRATAITVVEQAARDLSLGDQPVEISCGVAVVPPGLAARDALAAADAAQYAAKTRGALLVVASDLSDVEPERRRIRRRGSDRPRPASAITDGVTQVVTDLADRIAEAPGTVGGRMRWIGERLLAPLDLQEWSLSFVDLAGDRMLGTDSLGLRHTPITTPQPYDLQVDRRFRLDDYPMTEAAIERDAWFVVAVDDEDADPGERAVLHDMGMRHVVALGCRDAQDGWLLELYGRTPGLEVQAVGSVLALAASALLYRPFVQLSSVAQD
ncbi:sensor domain-containing diguanylate cyclase [Angustibacter peucedani]